MHLTAVQAASQSVLQDWSYSWETSAKSLLLLCAAVQAMYSTVEFNQ